ncbi:putative plus-end-directed kinesin ATPase [Medicago truncatula]|uniref:Kinesin-like protein n=1 Tax=Medicago truncatula TaxID=3880 RepID=G7L4H2_MEDTR|nr:kinesin-like protein KIN-10B isoform X2 [Medicago truncatula]AES79306.2 ATP-binding microtubule motor family protein [Medicago truncatula]RHN46103.1 putative plus-end-directed kinesin ATPase [Medicago truncatula]
MATTLNYSCTPPKAPINNNPISVSKVRVIVRVRPFLPHETSRNCDDPVSCISLLDQDFQSQNDVAVYLKDPFTSRKECYKLDSFFDQEDNNVGQIFEREVSPMIPAIFGGCNATVFAYGATGSGKTYTMQGTEEQPGLMPLAMSTILSICQNTSSTAQISYYEVYMDRCYDLLELKASEISVLDGKDGHIHLRGLSQVPVNTMSEFQEVFSSGIQRRKTAHTGLNDVSSRSHGVLVISILSTPPDGNGSFVCGKLNLIDLAGNEDNRRSCNEGIRLQESAKINQSLFALSNVIYALNNNKPRTPYRDSKLTRILQDSLGGSSRALMVACLNPGEYQESVHTVSLAARSRHVSNFVPSAHKLETSKVNVDMETKLKAWLESRGKTKSSQQRLGAFNSPLVQKTPGSTITSAKRSVNFNNSVKGGRTFINQKAQHTTERAFGVSFRNLLDGEVAFDSCKKNMHSGVEDNDKRETEHEANKAPLESYNDVPDEPLSKDVPAVLPSPLRKALSPININGIQNSLQTMSLTRTPFSATCSTKKGLQENGTPLDKFSARSSVLKNCLVQEYIDLLNNASREELQELKGIGDKMADYIIDLREESPLKSLCDLEKIGLSLKQAHNLFTKAAKKLFDDKAEDSMLK